MIHDSVPFLHFLAPTFHIHILKLLDHVLSQFSSSSSKALLLLPSVWLILLIQLLCLATSPLRFAHFLLPKTYITLHLLYKFV